MTSDNNIQKKCGFCGESIPARAGRCPYCGSILEVTFDNSYQINQEDIRPAGPDTGVPAGQEQQTGQERPAEPWNAEPQQSGQNAGADLSAAQTQSGGEQQGEAGPAGTAPQDDGRGQQQAYVRQMQNAYRPYGSSGYRPDYNYGSGVREPLSNGMKVFLTVLFTVLPGIGQLAGIIAAIVFMNSEGDNDRKSFGVALLVASLIMFVVSCIGCFVFILAFSSNQMNY